MPVKTVYSRWDPTLLQWIDFYFKSSMELIDETAEYKRMTAAERTAISDYLATFNSADKLVKVNAAGAPVDPGKIPAGLMPDLSLVYLPLAGGQMAGPIIMNDNSITGVAQVSKGTGNLYIGDFDGGGDHLGFYADRVELRGVDHNIKINPNEYTDFSGKPLKYVGYPVDSTDAATKAFVENLVAVGARPAPGGPATVASTSNYSSFPSAGPITIDGVEFLTADLQTIRVLIKNQSTLSTNGVYTVTRNAGNSLSWSKVAADSGQGILIFVEFGATQNDWIYHNHNGNEWSAYSKPDTALADNLTLQKSGQTFSIKNSGISNTHIGSAAAIDTSKLANEGSSEATAWASMAAVATENSLATKIAQFFSAIKLLRGTANYNTNNSESIAGAYAKLLHLAPSEPGCKGYLLSTSNIAALSGSQTIDGVASGTDGKLIILTAQSTSSQNGVYRTAVGAWTKVDGFIVNGFYVATNGSANSNKIYKASSTTVVALLYSGTANFPAGISILSYV